MSENSALTEKRRPDGGGPSFRTSKPRSDQRSDPAEQQGLQREKRRTFVREEEEKVRKSVFKSR